MKATPLVLFLATIMLGSPAHAELSGDILDREYQTCLGADPDPDKAAYCVCVRDGMRSWTLDDYGETASQSEVATSVGGSLPAKVQELGQRCIAQVLR